MLLAEKDIERLGAFIERLKKDVYPERESELHASITERVIGTLLEQHPGLREKKILDVGCGKGPALKIFSRYGCKAVGISLSEDDVRDCCRKGFKAQLMDQSFLQYGNATFGFVWCRHCLEHSPFPMFTLQEFYRVLEEEGYLYLEMPAPDTACHHETNPNHYSVLTQNAWSSLIERSNFKILSKFSIEFETPLGPDVYLGFFAYKK